MPNNSKKWQYIFKRPLNLNIYRMPCICFRSLHPHKAYTSEVVAHVKLCTVRSQQSAAE